MSSSGPRSPYACHSESTCTPRTSCVEVERVFSAEKRTHLSSTTHAGLFSKREGVIQGSIYISWTEVWNPVMLTSSTSLVSSAHYQIRGTNEPSAKVDASDDVLAQDQILFTDAMCISLRPAIRGCSSCCCVVDIDGTGDL